MAGDAIRDLEDDQVEDLLARLEIAIAETMVEIPELGLDCSVFPGEDDGLHPPSSNVVSYVLDLVLRHATGPCLIFKNKAKRLLDLAVSVTPEQLVALLTIHADRGGDVDGVERGAEILRRGLHPYREVLGAAKRRSAAGRESGQQRRDKNAPRDRSIREAADGLRASGKAKHEIAGILAQQRWDGERLSVRTIRRILKNADTN
jgi:hypothetical protein